MKQIFSYLIPYRARMAVGFSIKVAATIVELLIPWALSIMVDKVIPTENIGFVFAWGGAPCGSRGLVECRWRGRRAAGEVNKKG